MSHPIITNKRSVIHQPSEMAMATATLRALAAYDERKEIRGPDYLAEIFLTEDRVKPLKDPAARQWIMQNRITPGSYEFMIARTAFFDQIFRVALEQNTAQIVLLGAGYDSRPYRFKHLIQETRIYELDAPPTQNRKKDMLERTATVISDQVVLIPIDFSQENLTSVLLTAGFSEFKPAVFIWEGVTYYLSSEVIDSTLSSIGALSATGSMICFDFASLSMEAFNQKEVRQLREKMKTNHPAEQTHFGIPQGTLARFLDERGFKLVECVSPSEMEARYLTLRDGTVIGSVPSLFSLAQAIVNK